MPVSLRDLRTAKRALHAKCKLHPSQAAAACPDCHALAAMQQDKQWRRQREVAHADYLQRIAKGA